MHIVLATDLTDSSVDAARYAVARARLIDADLTVAHVVGSADIDTRDAISFRYQMRRHEPDAKPIVEEFEHAKANEVREWFEEAAGDVSGIAVSYAIEFGDLPEVIWSIVEEVDATSIVV